MASSESSHQVRYTPVGQDVPKQSTSQDPESASVEVSHRPVEEDKDQEGRCTTTLIRKMVIGLIIVIGISVSWVSLTQFIKSTYSPTFSGPFFTIWFTTAWMMLCYPVHIAGTMVISKEKRKGGIRKIYDEDQAVFGPSGLTWLSCLKFVGPFTVLWIATNYMYASSLSFIQPADVTAIFTTNTAFVYVASWIWLEEKLVLLPAKSMSVLFSVGGTILICYSDGFGSSSTLVGVALVLGSAVGAALYKVFFKKFMPADTTFGQVSLFLSILGWLDLIIYWPIMLALYYTGVEKWDWTNMPWVFLVGSALLTVVFNFLVNYGIAVTFPLFIALGNLIGLPLNAAVDWKFRDIDYGWIKVGGTILIIFGFIILLLPEQWQQKITCWREGSCPCERTLDSRTASFERIEGDKKDSDIAQTKSSTTNGTTRACYYFGRKSRCLHRPLSNLEAVI